MTRPMSATDRAYHETRGRILDGELAGGDVITEGQVSTSLGISRTPVREAFLRLQAEGLLQLYPKRGAVVVPVSVEEATSVMEARETAGVLETANFYKDHVIPAMNELRVNADELETLTSKAYWPFPSYGDLLFGVR